jgi:predicted DNA-binding protein (MmcQ/YjbR family)
LNKRSDVPPSIVAHLQGICRTLPEAREEQAWVGTRWRIRTRTFAHLLFIEGGWPPAYARAAAADGPITVLTFRSSGEELEVLRHAGHPFFAPPWRADEVGMILDGAVDWDEIRELVTESYCVLAPRGLRAFVIRPTVE